VKFDRRVLTLVSIWVGVMPPTVAIRAASCSAPCITEVA
jgi:hypothetical protein